MVAPFVCGGVVFSIVCYTVCINNLYLFDSDGSVGCSKVCLALEANLCEFMLEYCRYADLSCTTVVCGVVLLVDCWICNHEVNISCSCCKAGVGDSVCI